MEVELVEKLKDMQKSIEEGQNKQTRMLNQAINYLTDYINRDKIRIATLEVQTRYTQKELEDMNKIKESRLFRHKCG